MASQHAKTATKAPGIFLLFVLPLAWGLNWPMMKIGLGAIPPWTFRTYSSIAGGLLLLALALAGGQRLLPRGREWGRIALVGVFNITFWQMLLTYSLMRTASGSAALLAYTMPLWVALIGACLGDRPHLRLVLSLGAGMAGIVLLMSKSGLQAGTSPLATFLMLGGALSWAIGTQLQMRLRWELKAIPIAAWQLLLGSVPMFPVMLLLEGWWPQSVSPAGWLSWAYMAFIALSLGYAMWFKLIEVTSAQVAAIASLLAPVIAVLSGAAILGEPLGWREIAATVAIISGVVLARGGSPQRKAQPAPVKEDAQ